MDAPVGISRLLAVFYGVIADETMSATGQKRTSEELGTSLESWYDSGALSEIVSGLFALEPKCTSILPS